MRGAQHVQKAALGNPKPANARPPVVKEDAEGRPGPVELAQCLDKAPDGAASLVVLDMVAELSGFGAQIGVSVDLAPQGDQGFALRNSVQFEGVTRHADCHEAPEVDPEVTFGSDGGNEGLVVSRLGRGARCLDVSPGSAHTGSE